MPGYTRDPVDPRVTLSIEAKIVLEVHGGPQVASDMLDARLQTGPNGLPFFGRPEHRCLRVVMQAVPGDAQLPNGMRLPEISGLRLPAPLFARAFAVSYLTCRSSTETWEEKRGSASSQAR